jgi:outer membrane receptor protein involved in Fe transport
MWLRRLCFSLLLTASSVSVYAQVFGTVRGTVLDPQGSAIIGAEVTLKAYASAFTKMTQTDGSGSFTFTAVPADSYTVEVQQPGFQTTSQVVNVTILSAPVLRFVMPMAGIETSAAVTTEAEPVNTDASSPPVTVSASDILHTPGADRSASIAFITNYVPGSFLLHDHLHIRGGHQVSWLVDGVPVPNTNLSSNIGRQVDPKDIETVEVSRGGYSAKYGDRTYGMVNIVPRSGFEFSGHEFELTTGYGSFNQTNDQLSFGGHSNKFAYYGSVSGNRTDLGLEPPEKTILHNNGNGTSGFTTLNYNLSDKNQLRLAASLRRDHYWIPNTAADQALGIRDLDDERDGFANFSWVHIFNAEMLLTVSPFYHYNNAQYRGGLNDPLVTNDNRTSKYTGAQAVLGFVKGAHNLNGGLYFFHQHDDRTFGLKANDGSGLFATETSRPAGSLSSAFVDEQFKPTDWLTLNSGIRLTHYGAAVIENSADPRVGGSVRIPKLRWVARAFYGRYYQAPPLSTLSGPVFEFAVREGFGFLPLKGERDSQYEFGLSIPIGNWGIDLARFDTNARNFSDHEVLGNSNIALPLSIEKVHSRGSEVTIHSPQIGNRVHLHLAYSNMIVQGIGGVTGGMTDFAPAAGAWFYIDHDQRQTLTTGGEVTLPRNAYINANVIAGSGFLDGDGPQHLPAHTSLDIAVGKSLRENLSATFSALNITNNRYLLGRASSFAGTHYNDPRQFTVQFRYRFHL